MELADRLPFCPRCAYPFTGLPEAHQCPECGLLYDAGSQMWVSHLAEPRLGRYTMMGFASVITMFGLFQVIASRGRINALLGGINIFLGIGNFYMVYQKSKKKQRFIAHMPDGFWYVSRYHKVMFIPWTDIRSVGKPGDRELVAFRIFLNPRGAIDVPLRLVQGIDIQHAVEGINARIAKLPI